MCPETRTELEWQASASFEEGSAAVEPHYSSTNSNPQGAQMILFPLMTTWMWFQVFKASPLLAFVPRRREHQQR
jgi:hypothetical protein